MADIVLDVQIARVPMVAGRTVTVTGDLGGKTPKAVMIYGGSDTLESTNGEGGGTIGVGWTDGNAGSVVASFSEDATSLNNGAVEMASTSGADHPIFRLINATGATFVQFEFDAFVENGVRFTVTDPDSNFTGRSIRDLAFVFFAGDDLQAHVVAHDMGNTTSPTTVSGVGFEPDVVLTMLHGSGLNTFQTAGSRLSIGAVANDGAGGITHRSMFIADDDGSAGNSNEEYGYMSDADIIDISSTTGSILRQITLENFGADGFDVASGTATANDGIGFLCLEFGGESFDLSTYTIPTTEGDVVTNVGFTPRMGILFGANAPSLNTVFTTATQNPVVGINCFTDLLNNASFTVRYGTPAAGAITIRGHYLSDRFIHTAFGGNTNNGAHGELQSFDANGFTINWGRTGSSDRFGFLLCIGDRGSTDTLDKTTQVDHSGNFFTDNNPNWGRERVLHKDNPWTDSKQIHQIISGKRSFARTQALRTGLGVDIYILDRGVSPDHVEFANDGGRVTNLTDLTGDGDPPNASDADQAHGTYVAGAAAGQWSGVATRANIFSIRIIDDSDSVPANGIEDGLEEVITHASGRTNPFVVNISIQNGSNDAGDQTDIDTILGMGGVVVSLPGNTYQDYDDVSSGYPGRYDGVFVAAGSDVLDLIYRNPHSRGGIGDSVGTSGSGYGANIDCFAPAVNMCLPGHIHSREYQTVTGTSFAAPTTAGVMACLLEGRTRWSSAAAAEEFYEEVRSRCIRRRMKVPGFIDDTTDRMIYLDPLDAP